MWPSKVGVAKPFYFPFTSSYWFPQVLVKRADPTQPAVICDENGLRIALTDSSDWRRAENPNPILSSGTSAVHMEAAAHEQIHIESAHEHLLGKPTVVLDKLRKTFSSQVAVNDLSFSMYENQIFALLGHNGAGKVTD